MVSYFIRRLFYMLFLVILVSVVSFLIIQLPPGDYVTTQLANLEATGAQVDEVLIENSTVSRNYLEGEYQSGAGIFNCAQLLLVGSTIADNSAGFWGSGDALAMGCFGSNAHADVARTLVDGECVEGDDAITALDSGGYNIESEGDTCGFDQPTDLVNVTSAALNLGPLQDNGGPTMTHELLTTPAVSVAIDAVPEADCLDAEGLPLTTDQRGEPRPVALLGPEPRCDVGAFEVQP